MKKLLLLGIAAAFSLVSASAHAKAKYGMAGCGLGTFVFKENNKMQVLAATTNATGVQTFGITTGTSNCTAGDKTAELQRQQQFILANLSTLNKEMAEGSGDTLKAFAATLGCEQQAFP